MEFERNLLAVLRGEKKAPLLLASLAPFGAVYRSLIAARNMAYDRGIFATAELPVPVISIGNIAVGGTGKTPLTHLLAMELQDKMRLAILSRGYLSQLEKHGRIAQISSGKGPQFPSEYCGDEPYFLASKTKASVWVGADRVASGQQAIEAGAQCLLLDDGMQHRRIHRDVEIVLIDANDPFSRGRFLPWGLLRDSPKRLRSAHLIVATHIRDEEHYQSLVRELSFYTPAPVVGTQIEVLNPDAFASLKVGLFCGIGQPERFVQTARDLKSEIVDTLFVKDHGSLQKQELQKFAKKCRNKGAEALLCTEKDYVKLSPEISLSLEVVPVEIRMKIAAGKEHWEALIENILDKVVK